MRIEFLFALAVIGCGGPAYDPALLIAERAPTGADDCGQVDGWGHTPPAPARACVVAALAAPRAFHVLIDAAVADGRIAVGFASDGAAALFRLDYHAVYPAIGSTDEDVAWTECSSIDDLGAACSSLNRDLCFDCTAR